MSRKRLDFIGCGNMVGAIMEGIISGGLLKPEEMAVYDITPEVSLRVEKKGLKMHRNPGPVRVCGDGSADGEAQCSGRSNGHGGKEVGKQSTIADCGGNTIERLRKMTDSEFHILCVMPNAPTMVCFSAETTIERVTALEESQMRAAVMSSMTRSSRKSHRM